jgi:hypothetical protein
LPDPIRDAEETKIGQVVVAIRAAREEQQGVIISWAPIPFELGHTTRYVATGTLWHLTTDASRVERCSRGLIGRRLVFSSEEAPDSFHQNVLPFG